jgi:ribosomal protein L32
MTCVETHCTVSGYACVDLTDRDEIDLGSDGDDDDSQFAAKLVGKMTTIVFPSGKKLNIVISTYMHDAEMIKAQKKKRCGNVQVVHTTHKSCFYKSSKENQLGFPSCISSTHYVYTQLGPKKSALGEFLINSLESKGSHS